MYAMISRCYLEITNICNLNCLFCPKTQRVKRRMSSREFDILTDELKGKVRFLYFHLMGEPFLHPQLAEFVCTARKKGFIPVITTNGTLLAHADEVIEAHPYKIQISLHSQEGNGMQNAEDYINHILTFSQKAASEGIIVILRLWNKGGYEENNNQLLDWISNFHPRPWIERHDGWKVAENLFIEYDRKFEWPDSNREAYQEKQAFCYALRNQIGVLVDGSVVPCCLDHEGDIVLGNLFNQPLDEILSSHRAKALHDGFTRHETTEPLCQRCGYALVTKKFRTV